MSSQPAISLQGLTKMYGTKAAVRDLSFEVPAGAVLGFLGKNGAGKTTTIRMLLGLVAPSSGTARILGRDVVRDRKGVSAKVGGIVETPGFYPHLTGRQNLAVVSLSAGRAVRPDADDLLRRVGLQAASKQTYATYSLGMKQRLGIAAALSCDPEVLLLDEPTNGLDPDGAAEMRALIASLSSEGRTLLISSHLLAEVERVCTDLVIIKDGSAVVQGKMRELLNAGAVNRLKVSSVEKACALLGPRATAAEGSTIALECEEPEIPQALRLLLGNGVEVYAVERRSESLEALFLKATA